MQEERVLSQQQVTDLQKKLSDPNYLDWAIERIANTLSAELLTSQYNTVNWGSPSTDQF
jgi:hypothetical protein